MKVRPLISNTFCFKRLMPNQRAVQAATQAVGGRGGGSQPQWRRFRRSPRPSAARRPVQLIFVRLHDRGHPSKPADTTHL